MSATAAAVRQLLINQIFSAPSVADGRPLITSEIYERHAVSVVENLPKFRS